MEADQETALGIETTVAHKHASSTATPSPTLSEYRQRSSSNPQDGTPKHAAEHDSLVTVRLSEPPRQLTLDTNLSLNGSLVNRRSIFANTKLSPGSASPGALNSPFNPDAGMSPVVVGIPHTGYGQNLQDELDDAQEDDDSKTISGPEPAEDSDEEEVDWDQLQKTEDAESKENEEAVGFCLFPKFCALVSCKLGVCVCDHTFANCRVFLNRLLLRYWLGWSRKTIGLLRTRRASR